MKVDEIKLLLLMTYKEAQNHSLTVPWITESCGNNDCWCLMIKPEEPITWGNEDEENYYIIGAGALDKLTAEYIVELHNKALSKLIDAD